MVRLVCHLLVAADRVTSVFSTGTDEGEGMKRRPSCGYTGSEAAFMRIKNWCEGCLATHRDQCGEVPNDAVVLPHRVLDVVTTADNVIVLEKTQNEI